MIYKVSLFAKQISYLLYSCYLNISFIVYPVLEIRRCNRDNLGIIFHIFFSTEISFVTHL